MSELEVIDMGTTWHVVGDKSITKYQELDYLDRTNNSTGIKYAIGPKPLGGTGIAYVRYPKFMFVSADAIRASPDVARMLYRCNVCSAMDQVAQARGGKSPVEETIARRGSVPTTAVQVNPAFAPPVERISFGDIGGGNFFPRVVPFLLDTLGALALRPTGQALVKTALSLGADMLSGSVADPGLKRAWKAAADGLIDDRMLSPEFAETMRDDVAMIAESLQRDGDYASALKRGLVKTKGEILEPALKRKQVSLTKQQTTTYSVGIGPSDALTPSNMVG